MIYRELLEKLMGFNDYQLNSLVVLVQEDTPSKPMSLCVLDTDLYDTQTGEGLEPMEEYIDTGYDDSMTEEEFHEEYGEAKILKGFPYFDVEEIDK